MMFLQRLHVLFIFHTLLAFCTPASAFRDAFIPRHSRPRHHLQLGATQRNKAIVDELLALVETVQPNGLIANSQQQDEINNLIKKLEAINPTRNPAKSDALMGGFWKLLYTDFDEPNPSNGKLGPFTGDVYQDIYPQEQIIKNIIDVKFPPIRGALVADSSVESNDSWRIVFDRIGFEIMGGLLPSLKVPFPRGEGKEQVRIWKITYLDEELKVIRGKRPEMDDSEAYIFFLLACNESKFPIKA